MIRTLSFTLLLAPVGAFTACAGASVPRDFVVPEDAENPIKVEFRGATAADLVPLIARVCSDVALPTLQIDRRRGYVETRFVDIAQFEQMRFTELPLEERQVMYTFEVDEEDPAARHVRVSAIYQPLRPPGTSPRRDSRYNRLVPTDHPGYQLALELEFRLRRAMTEAGVVLVEGGG